ncbi:hypothetical protein Plhal304r1_c030g0099261 [Plasmopara halstedii]
MMKDPNARPTAEQALSDLVELQAGAMQEQLVVDSLRQKQIQRVGQICLGSVGFDLWAENIGELKKTRILFSNITSELLNVEAYNSNGTIEAQRVGNSDQSDQIGEVHYFVRPRNIQA